MMRERRLQLIVTFFSTAEAMAMERKAKEAGLPGRIIPLPSKISAGCGLCWKAETEQRDILKVFLQEQKLKWQQMYELELY